ncbi:unnamed protein product [Lota lota]
MQPVLLALLLAALHSNVPVTSSAELREKEPNQRRRFGGGKSVERYVATKHFPLKLIGRRSANRDVTGKETTNFVSIFDSRRKLFLCKENDREPQNWDEARVACLFGNIWFALEPPHGQAWKPSLEETGGWKTNQGSRQLSSAPRKELLARPLVSRRRRADPVNPSDPLRSESHPGNPAHEHRDPEVSEQDQAGAVSKETIISCDDPLKVLHSIRPVSPIKSSIAERADQD